MRLHANYFVQLSPSDAFLMNFITFQSIHFLENTPNLIKKNVLIYVRDNLN